MSAPLTTIEGMAASRQPGKGFLAKALSAVERQPAHPIVSAVQFGALTRDTGGATMNVHTGAFTGIGSPGYGVGGMRADKPLRAYSEPAASGKRPSAGASRIPTRSVAAPGGDLDPATVLSQRNRIRRMTTGQPAANLGSWHTGDGRADIDASEVEHDRATAVTKGTRRREKAIFDYKAGKDINL